MSSQAVEIKVRLIKNHPEIHKESKKLVGILRQRFGDKKKGIVFFPFLNKRFVIPIRELKELKK